MTMGPLVLEALAVLVLQASPAQPANPPQPPPASAPAPPPPGEAYKYNPDGRRDPFLSLINSGTGDPKAGQARRAEGVAGMTVAEISVRGILQSRGALIGIVQGPDNKTYLVHQGDKLADGSVQQVTAEGLVIMQEVNDPLSLVKQRVVRKPLRPVEDVKQ
jgi:Tfp pilus assembly protein PilP